MVDGRNGYARATVCQPCAHSRGIEDLAFFHHHQDQCLGHSVTAALSAAPLFPAARAFDGFSLPGANQTTHVSPLLFLFSGGWMRRLEVRMPLASHEISVPTINSLYLRPGLHCANAGRRELMRLCRDYPVGKEIRNRVPHAWSDSTSMAPPWRATISLTMNRPRPSPPEASCPEVSREYRPWGSNR